MARFTPTASFLYMCLVLFHRAGCQCSSLPLGVFPNVFTITFIFLMVPLVFNFFTLEQTQPVPWGKNKSCLLCGPFFSSPWHSWSQGSGIWGRSSSKLPSDGSSSFRCLRGQIPISMSSMQLPTYFQVNPCDMR